MATADRGTLVSLLCGLTIIGTGVATVTETVDGVTGGVIVVTLATLVGLAGRREHRPGENRV